VQICHVALDPPGVDAERRIVRLLADLGDLVDLSVVVRQGSSLHLRLIHWALPRVEIHTVEPSVLKAAVALPGADLFHCHDDVSVLAAALRSVLGTRIAATCHVDRALLSRPLIRWSYRQAEFVVLHEPAVATKFEDNKITSPLCMFEESLPATGERQSRPGIASQLHRLYSTAIFGVGWIWDCADESSSNGAENGHHGFRSSMSPVRAGNGFRSSASPHAFNRFLDGERHGVAIAAPRRSTGSD